MKSRKFLCCQLRALVLILIGGQSWVLYSIICWISSLFSVYSCYPFIFVVVGVSAGMQLFTRTSWTIKDLVNIICSAQCMLYVTSQCDTNFIFSILDFHLLPAAPPPLTVISSHLQLVISQLSIVLAFLHWNQMLRDWLSGLRVLELLYATKNLLTCNFQKNELFRPPAQMLVKFYE